MQKKSPVLQIAIPSPLFQTFDYLPPDPTDVANILPGMRVQAPFGKTLKTGVIICAAADSRIASQRLRPVSRILDDEPALPPDIMQLLGWAADYYHHPIGEVISTALPTLLRSGEALRPGRLPKIWRLSDEGSRIDSAALTRATRQQALILLLRQQPDGMTAEQLNAQTSNWRATMRILLQKGWVNETTVPTTPDTSGTASTCNANHDYTANPAQQQAIDTVASHLDSFATYLLDGVTGSGKTEVYFQLIAAVIEAGRQALILVPEIGLTPQLLGRFQQRFNAPIAMLHSGISDQQRLAAWHQARAGEAAIVIGTRSAVFTPLKRPGIIIIDEEHDQSFKQQDGFRYHARDIAIVRAKRAGIPVVLGSATPSLESLHNANQGRYQSLTLPERVGNANHPAIRLLDVRHDKMDGMLSPRLLSAIQHHLNEDNQVLLYLNRRGFAPTMICHDCGWVASCQRCDAHMILHQSRGRLRCHHCDAQRVIDSQCPQCGSVDLRPLGHGTERVETVLHAQFPDTDIIRIDRDSTRRKGLTDQLLEKIRHGRRQILLGTQMLAKGHHLPNVTLVGILDADQGLFGIDFRATERMGQLILQVAGRAGRVDKPGEVLIQTHHPQHPLLLALMTHDYHHFAKRLLDERQQAELPPFSNLALLRAEAVKQPFPIAFLGEARQLAQGLDPDQIQLLGPIPSAMERRAGRYRAQLLLQTTDRKPLHQLLKRWVNQLDTLPSAKKVRWSLDVDPMDLC